MKFTINYTKHNSLLYIVSTEGSSDRIIARLINMTIDEYQTILLEKFNGILFNDISGKFYDKLDEYAQIYFKEKEHAEKAIDWIESIIVMKKLAN